MDNFTGQNGIVAKVGAYKVRASLRNTVDQHTRSWAWPQRRVGPIHRRGRVPRVRVPVEYLPDLPCVDPIPLPTLWSDCTGTLRCRGSRARSCFRACPQFGQPQPGISTTWSYD